MVDEQSHYEIFAKYAVFILQKIITILLTETNVQIAKCRLPHT